MHKLKLLVGLLGLWSLASSAVQLEPPPPGINIIGENQIIKVKAGQSILSIAQQYDLPALKIVEANPQLRSRNLKIGEKLILPTQLMLPPERDGIVINLAELRLFYFSPDGRFVYTYPVAVGRQGWETPIAVTSVSWKEANPTWYVPKSVHDYMLAVHHINLPPVVPPGPRNPLGKYALHLKLPSILIHGTNAPSSIGTYATSGCIRMYPEDIEQLYNLVRVGTPVHLVYYTETADWEGSGHFYLKSQENSPVNNTSSSQQVVIIDNDDMPSEVE